MALGASPSVDFKALFEKSPGFYLILDTDLRVVAATDAYCQAVRSTRENLLGLRIRDMFPNPEGNPGVDGFDKLQVSLERVLSLKRPDTMAIQRFDIRRPKREGGGFIEKYWSPRNVPILDVHGEVRWIVHRVYDVTSAVLDPDADESRRMLARTQTRMILELQRANDELAQLDGLRSGLLHMARLSTVAMMASALAHDVSQPLTAARNYLNALKRVGTVADPKAEELIGKLGQQIERAGDIVKALRNQMAAGTTVHRPEDVASVVADAARLAEIALRRADARLTLAIAPGLPPVKMDRIQVQQVLVNLVTNAAEAVTGRATRAISIAVRLDGKDLLFEVADSGPGLPADVTQRLFEPFASTKLMGMGLGLPIARQIVSEHKGTMWVGPNRPEGTVVSFTLAREPVTALQMA